MQTGQVTIDFPDMYGNTALHYTQADKLAVYSELVDEAGIDVPVQADDSDAQLVAGCHVSPLAKAVLKDPYKTPCSN